MNWEKNRNLKIFFIGDLLESHAHTIEKKEYEKRLKSSGVEDWQEVLWNKNELTEIKEYATKISNAIWGRHTYTGYPLSAISRTKYQNALLKDQQEEQELTDFKNKKDQLQSLVHDYEKGLKVVIGNDDLTNWETKITKTGTNDKDITDLRKKVTDLQTTKDNLDKELKDKQDQILNHKCDTPNNNELNQLKDDLKKAYQEKERLQTELGKDSPNIPTQTPQQQEEEDKKEEQEIQNLTVEELRKKLNSKQQEIRNLQEQLAKQNNSQSVQNSKKDYSQFLFGMAVSFSLAAVVGGMIYLIGFYKKKKKKQ